jgi:hypothetical protein
VTGHQERRATTVSATRSSWTLDRKWPLFSKKAMFWCKG